MNKMTLGFGASLLLTAVLSVSALAADPPAAPAPAAPEAPAPAAPEAPAPAAPEAPAPAAPEAPVPVAPEAPAPAAPAAAPAEQPKAEVAAPAAQPEQAAKPAKKAKKHRKHHKKVVKPCPAPVEEAATSRRAELSQAMAREVEKRKGTAPYGAEARAKDLDRDIENMTKAASLVVDEAHKARIVSMLEHLKALRARYNP